VHSPHWERQISLAGLSPSFKARPRSMLLGVGFDEFMSKGSTLWEVDEERIFTDS
jgi:hypothetical protein